jgi:hypothetical protein
MEVSSTTDAIPIAIPSIERAERILFARNDPLPIERRSRLSTSLSLALAR